MIAGTEYSTHPRQAAQPVVPLLEPFLPPERARVHSPALSAGNKYLFAQPKEPSQHAGRKLRRAMAKCGKLDPCLNGPGVMLSTETCWWYGIGSRGNDKEIHDNNTQLSVLQVVKHKG